VGCPNVTNGVEESDAVDILKVFPLAEPDVVSGPSLGNFCCRLKRTIFFIFLLKLHSELFLPNVRPSSFLTATGAEMTRPCPLAPS
jgi:hypothetical protein